MWGYHEYGSDSDDGEFGFSDYADETDSPPPLSDDEYPDFKNLANEPELRQRELYRQFANSTLFDLTAKTIFNRRRYFCDFFERTGFNLFTTLSKRLRVKLIESKKFKIDDKEAEFDCKMLNLLLNDNVSRVCLSEFPEKKKAIKCVSDTLCAMSAKCPELQEIVCEEVLFTEEDVDASKRFVVFFGLALQFAQLQVLQMPNLECDNFRLQMLADHVPNLRVLQVELGATVSSSGISALAKLQHLQHFLYCDNLRERSVYNKVSPQRKYFYSLCVRFLPWLQVSGCKMKFELCINNYPTDFMWQAQRDLKRRLPSRLELKHLSLGRASEMPVGVALPNLQTLYLYKPKINFRFGPAGFPCLTKLVLLRIKQPLLERILALVGRQLRKLSVSLKDTLQLHKVFQLCPKLEVFYVTEHSGHVDLTEPLGDLRRITKLKFSDEDCSEAILSLDQLMQILRAAPNLRVLHLDYFVFTEQARTEICNALQQKLILQHLQQFFFYYDPDCRIFDFQDQSNCYRMFRSFSFLCPKLTTLKYQDTWM